MPCNIQNYAAFFPTTDHVFALANSNGFIIAKKNEQKIKPKWKVCPGKRCRQVLFGSILRILCVFFFQINQVIVHLSDPSAKAEMNKSCTCVRLTGHLLSPSMSSCFCPCKRRYFLSPSWYYKILNHQPYSVLRAHLLN